MGGGKDGGKGGGMDMMQMMMAMMMGGGMDGGKGGKGGKGSKAQMKLAKGEKVYHGTLRYFNAEKNHGFIQCQEIMNEHGSEVYSFKNMLEEAQAGVGDEIAFFLHWSGKGQPQCSSPVIRLASAVENNLVLKGTFKNKNAEKGFGFIECWECSEFFGRDVYVPANLAEGLEPGTLVAFNATLNREGMPNARMVCACEEGYAPQPGDLSVTSELPKGKGKGGMDPAMMAMMSQMGMPPEMMMMMMKGKGKGGKGKGPYGGGPKQVPKGTGQFIQGTVKSFKDSYGFIASDEVKAQYGGDVFVGGKDLANFTVGQSVLFQLALTDDGKPHGMDITALS